MILTWGQFGDLKKWLGVGYIDVTSSLKRAKQIWSFSSRLKSISQLDIAQFERFDASDHNWGAKVVEQAKAHNKHLAKVTKVYRGRVIDS
ncbi:hypothetical protein [Glaciecola sp. KUL10]|uniref:hypothetical protein n=1 Tax=Glaciecola sp. (strain KUL10) TaxID=2161813 RepID=UPI000D781B4E|nr:hypothetical protein [Glaciecola sp. KUL10]GBL03318.1 integron gene cassette protein [Glaciecola sp. KUL10]